GKMDAVLRSRSVVLLLVLTALAAACTSGGDPDPSPTGPTGGVVSAGMASSDHYVGAPQRVAIGLQVGDGRLVTFGSVDVSFSYLGTAEAPVDAPESGPATVAVYLPTPGTADGAGGPTLSLPSEARGVYQAEDVTFDRAGFWQADITADVQGLGVQRTSTTLEVLDDPEYPAPGEAALETENLTLDSTDAPPEAIDSRAATEGEVPDPELHEWTIARALQGGRPALVVFSTPVYCVSKFCGPVTDVVQQLAARYDDRAVFIHVEIWRDNRENVMNEGAADWLLTPEGFTEPWLFLIGADGTILDRWANLWREDEVVAALEALPRMDA
ncbi:MAG: hypothetical protein WD834_06280, partial [Actinomycetota bacterium]